MGSLIIPDGEWFPQNVYAFTKDNGRRFWQWMLCREHHHGTNTFLFSVAVYQLMQFYDVDQLYAEEYLMFQIRDGHLVRRGNHLHFTGEGKRYLSYLQACSKQAFSSLKPVLHFELYRYLLQHDVPRTVQAFHTYLYDHYNTNENQLYSYLYKHLNDGSLTCVPHPSSSKHYLLNVSEPSRT